MSFRFSLGAILALAAAFILQWGIAQKVRSNRTVKDASNYWSTQARLQAAAKSQAKVVLLGSSITGRLPGAEQGDPRVANLGCDGSTASDGVDLLLAGLCDSSGLLVFETNTLERYLLTDSSEESGLSRGPWFDVGVLAPLVSAGFRPSGLAYSYVLSRSAVLADQVEPFSITTPFIQLESQGLDNFSSDEVEKIEDLAKRLRALRKNGGNLILVEYPSKPIDEDFKEKQEQIVAWLADQFGIPFLDLNAQVDPNLVQMTDAVHMAPASAARTLKTLVDLNFSQ